MKVRKNEPIKFFASIYNPKKLSIFYVIFHFSLIRNIKNFFLLKKISKFTLKIILLQPQK